MGTIISSVPEIDSLNFEQMPSSRPVAIEKAVRCGSAYILKGKNGRLYSNVIGKFAYVPGRWPWQNDVMKGLVKLGAITKEQMEAHLLRCSEVAGITEKRRDLQELKRLEKKYGLDLKPSQIKAVSP
jgi:hypothetical protein